MPRGRSRTELGIESYPGTLLPMLVLSRKSNETIVIDGRIIVKVVRVEGGTVRIGIEAPIEVPVHRQEVFDEIQRNNREALNTGTCKVS